MMNNNDKETRDFSNDEFIDWMITNNPNNVFKEIIGKKTLLLTYIPIEQLNFPDGWYITKDHTLTNKGNSSSGIYNCIDIFFTRKEL